MKAKWRRKLRTISMLLVFVLLANLSMAYEAGATETGQTGQQIQEIPEGYTPVYGIADLYAIRNNTSGNYILMNDIDMTEATSEGGDYDCGTGWDSIETFSGTLDGNGHKIIGMRIEGELEAESRIGLFETLSNATIKNLGVVDCMISVSDSFGSDIDNTGYYGYIGIIAGRGYGCTLNSCYVSGNITVMSKSDEKHYVGVAGLIGRCDNGIYVTNIYNCYNLCDIDCSRALNCSYIGGISANAFWAVISHTYNAGQLKGNEDTYVGAICGTANSYNSSVEACLYLKGTAEQGIGNNTPSIVSLSETQMKTVQCFTDFDFTDTWEIDPYCTYKYPQLKENRMIRVSSLQLTTLPEKRIYNQGDALDLGDAVVEIQYSDGIKTSVPVTRDMLSGYDMMEIGTQTVDVNYRGAKASFEIEVREISVVSVSIPETLSIYRAEEEQLALTILPENASDKTVAWESSDPSIASVDANGKVKAREEGTAIITATTANGLQAECEVTVLVPAAVINLNYSNISLKIGEKETLTAQLLPLESTDTVAWKSDRETVAVVKGGVVEARKAGTATITAYTESGITATCKVTVQNPDSTNNSNVNNGSTNSGAAASGTKTTVVKKESKAAKAKKAYKEYINKHLSSSYDYPYGKYKFYDINRDGTPELIFSYRVGVRNTYKIYTYKKGKVKKLKTIKNGMEAFYSKKKKEIYINWSNGGTSHGRDAYKIKNNKLKRVCRYKNRIPKSVLKAPHLKNFTSVY